MRSVRVLIAILIAYSHFHVSGPDGARDRIAFAQEAADSDAAQPSTAAGETPPGDGDLVIPPGQEQLLGEMLGQGAELPDGCRLVNGEIEYRVVKARYDCPAGEVILELAHPSRAAATAPHTDRFAITVQSGSPPDSLVTALESRIRSKEAGFQWQLIVPQKEHSRGPHDPLSGRSVSWVRLAVAGLFVIAIIGWIVRKRGAGKTAG
jgi:hypothetical protein